MGHAVAVVKPHVRKGLELRLGHDRVALGPVILEGPAGTNVGYVWLAILGNDQQQLVQQERSKGKQPLLDH